jgi:hypothetical protein
MNKHKFTPEKVIEVIEKAKGLVAPAATMLGVTRGTLYNYINQNQEVKEALDQARESMLDYTEGKLFENIKNNDTTAIIFALKSLGKKRGYIERQEHDHFNDGKAFSIPPITWVKNADEP